MPRNKSEFGDIALSPLAGRFDLRSTSGNLALGDFRLVLNASMNEMGKRCRRPQWRKFGFNSPQGFNNQDLSDQLTDVSTYCDGGADPNCTCPGVPSCLRVTNPEEVAFAYIADWGQLSNSPNPENVESLVQLHTPDFIVTGGDNRYGSVTFATLLATLTYYKTFVDSQLMFPTAGNHDVDDDGGIADYLSTFSYLPGDQRNYSIRRGPVEFFFRETHDTGTPPPDLTASAAWLQTALANSTAPWKIVITQDAPHTSNNDVNYPGHPDSQLPYKDWGADLLLCGDSHQYERIVIDDFNYIVCGAGGANRDTTFNAVPVDGSTVRYGDKHGCLICSATSHQLLVQFRNTDDEVIDSVTLSRTEPAENCVGGVASNSPAWDGTIERTDDCEWGFQFGDFSLDGMDVSAVIALTSCDPHRVYTLTITGRATTGQAVLIWEGESDYTAVGTYTRTSGCWPEEFVVESCAPCTQPVITASPPNGATVQGGSYVSIFATDGADIFYTTDGTDPDNSSTLYTGPFPIPEGGTVKAIAYSSSCISEIQTFTYTILDSDVFAFQYLCDAFNDYTGVFGVFEPNGSYDYTWRLVHNLPDIQDVVRLEIYETDQDGVWVTGQAWATHNPVYPAEMNGDPFAIYPSVIRENGSQINTEYVTPSGNLVTGISAGEHDWLMYGQPFIPNVGYFKLVFVYRDTSNVEHTVYSLIPNECECYGYSGYEGDYCEGYAPDNSGRSLVNVAFKRTTTSKVGAAAIGSGDDFWNTFPFKIQSEEDGSAVDDGISLMWADGTDSGMTLVPQVRVGSWVDMNEFMFDSQENTGHSDDMMEFCAKLNSGGHECFLRITGTNPGIYNIYVYGHGGSDNKTLRCFVRTPVVDHTIDETENSSVWQGAFSEGKNYVLFENVDNSWLIDGIEIVLEDNSGDGFGYINGIQIEKVG